MSLVEIWSNSTKPRHIPVLCRLVIKQLIVNGDFCKHTATYTACVQQLTQTCILDIGFENWASNINSIKLCIKIRYIYTRKLDFFLRRRFSASQIFFTFFQTTFSTPYLKMKIHLSGHPCSKKLAMPICVQPEQQYSQSTLRLIKHYGIH